MARPLKFQWFILAIIFIVFSFNSHFSVLSADTENLKISHSVGEHICRQQAEFQESSSIQNPVKQRPENDDAKCGWLNWSKCDSKDADCPSFESESCDEEPKTSKGRSAIAKPFKDENYCKVPLEFPGLEIVSPQNKYPSLVAIHRGINCYKRACWGLILNEEWLVVPQTSGCFVAFSPVQPDDFHIIAGDREIYVDEGTEQVRKVKKFISHPDFRVFNATRANLGLVQLDEPLEFNEDVQPIDLEAVKQISSSSGAPIENLKVATWLGEKESFEPIPDGRNMTNLIEFPVEFVPDSECYAKFMEEDESPKESLLCAGKCVVAQNGIDPGPQQGFLFTFQKSFAPTPISVPVPVGIGPIRNNVFSAKNGPFGVFTDLSFYIPWIEETIKNQGQSQGQGQQAVGSKSGSGRLSESEDAPPHKYPSIINFLANFTAQCRQHTCGGTILSANWILTAAHCVERPLENYRLIAGDHDQSKPDGSEQEVTVEKIIVNEAYNVTDALYNDIALVKVSPPLKLNDKVQAVKLPEQDSDSEGPFQAIGWGKHKGYSPHILQEAEMPLIPIEECDAAVNNYSSNVDPRMHICVGTEEKGACAGDSGSPLFVIGESGDQIIVGLASFVFPAISGDICGETTYSLAEVSNENGGKKKVNPTVYTRVSHYIDWIRKNADLS